MGSNESRPNDWNADDYDENHSFVAEYGTDVLELLAPGPDERILDLGCGTGTLTEQLAASGAIAVGIDSAPEMIEQARETYAEPTFVATDARTMSFDTPFDAIFSNAALHWIPAEEQDDTLRAVHDALRPGGRFVAELGGTGNVERIVDATLAELEGRGYDADSPWYFPSVGEYAGRLEDHGFEVRFARLFDRPTELDDGQMGLRNWLEMFGDSLFEPVPADERAAVIGGVEDRLEEHLYDRDEKTWTADYRRLRFRAVRR